MASNQQRREAAKRKLQRQNERRTRRARAMKQRMTILGVVAAVLIVGGVVWIVSSSKSGKDTVDAASGATSTADAYGDGTATGTAAATDAATDSPAPSTCAYPSDGSTPAKAVTAPTELEPAHEGTTDVTLTLNTGDVILQLDRAATPCTVNSFVSLAEQHYFDGTTCHRLTSSAGLKVLQCGDPTATGTGGPGYSFADELTGKETYGAGTLAMANSGANTNGSQFFIVYGDSTLPPSYTVFGKVTAGLDVVQAIAAKGTTTGGQDGAPKDPVTIEKVTIAG